MKVAKLRYILFTYMNGIIVFIAAAIGTKGNTGIAMLSLVLFFESCIFPTIFTLSLRGLSRHTKCGTSFLVSSVSSGAVFPPILGAVTDVEDARIAMCVPLASFLITWTFPIYLSLIKPKELDEFRESRMGTEGPVDAQSIAESYHGKDVKAARWGCVYCKA